MTIRGNPNIRVVRCGLTDGNVSITIPSAYTHPSTHPASMITGLATVATSGKYSDLSGRPSLATVATSGSYNDLSNKPSIPTTPSAYVTQTWSSGTSWYRKYSDGWIEQGGHVVGNSMDKRVNFNTPFSNNAYTVNVTPNGDRNNNSQGDWYMIILNRSTTYMTIRSYLLNACWHACGY